MQTYIVSALVCYVFPCFLQNVFSQMVSLTWGIPPLRASARPPHRQGGCQGPLGLNGKPFATSSKLKSAIDAALPDIDFKTELKLIDNTLVEGIRVDPAKFKDLEKMHVLDPEPLRRCGNWPERPSPTLGDWLRR